MERITALRQKALAYDGRILDSQASVSYCACRKLFLLEDRDLDQTVMWTNATVVAMASRSQELKMAKSCIGQYVASPLVTMHDGSAMKQSATMFFDDEGTLTGNTVIIDKGVLKTGICDALARLGVAPTGNGRRESYERKAYTRMTNTYFQGGDATPGAMIASKYDLILSGNAVPEVLSYYARRASAQAVYAKYSTWERGEDVQGEETAGEHLDVTLHSKELGRRKRRRARPNRA